MDKCYILSIQLCLIIVCVSTQNYEGDLCLHVKSNKEAKCKLVANCLSAIEDFKKGTLPQTCGFNGSTPLVCCVDSPTPPATTARPSNACLHVKSNKEAKCKLFQNCLSALEDSRKGIPPQTCGFNGSTSLVCCVDSPTTTSRPTLAIPTTPRTAKNPTPASSTAPQSDDYFGPPDGKVGRKSYEKCREYEKHVNVSYVLPGFTKVRYRDTCAVTSTQLIVGGTSAKTREFPHMAAIGYDVGDSVIGYFCAGSLISERFVITAAHCVVHRQFGPAKLARLGDLNLKITTEDAEPEDFSIIEAIKHPLYNWGDSYNDIALFKLDREVIFNMFVRPICLPVHRNPPGKKAIATGWGTVDFLHAQSDHLLKVTLEFFNFTECSAEIEVRSNLRNGVLEDMHICAGSRMDRSDICQGDSGGPLQIYHKDPDAYCLYMLVGITSYGKSCGVQNTPGVYTRVQHYLDWIEKIVWP